MAPTGVPPPVDADGPSAVQAVVALRAAYCKTTQNVVDTPPEAGLRRPRSAQSTAVTMMARVYEQAVLPSGATAWTSTGSSATTLAADGCVDLILRGDVVLVAGPSTRWLTTTADVSTVATVGLRFPPGAAAGALETDLAALRDTAVALEQVVDRPRALRLTTQMRDLAVHLPDRDPQRLVEVAPRARSPLWAQLVWASAREGRPVWEVCAELGWSESTLRRQVLAQFGYGYTALRRVERARRALALIGTGAPLGQVAARSGYADQSHMTRDFADLVGTTPGHAARTA